MTFAKSWVSLGLLSLIALHRPDGHLVWVNSNQINTVQGAGPSSRSCPPPARSPATRSLHVALPIEEIPVLCSDYVAREGRLVLDRTNMPEVPDGETAQEIRAKLIADIASSGLLPTPLKKLLSSTGGDV